ncbi:CU044_5270 family protein [Asanoa iriomotensis]|uniref:Uncharacterized protein n=1 Tax=Asanoa iriomotensis TaxID=234613 RepID=A0ABQ4C6T6_9ACTN|nr:CU044_5270 family protein [Asanoa iriomotensis]GIF58492.1 hypothetical protein Air01nite_45870 [Asanoa iriomotensis]
MLSGFEERLLAELRAHVATRPVPAPLWSRRRVVLTAAAVTLTGGAVAVPLVGERPAPASAALILQGAARAALREPPLTARPDQWVFTEQLVKLRPDPAVDRYSTRRIQRWVTAGAGDQWQQRFRDETPGSQWQAPAALPDGPRPAGYLAGLPTDADGMLGYLRAHPLDLELPAGADEAAVYADPSMVFTTASWWLEGYLPPASRAALFEAMAQVPGVTVAPGHVEDAAGRSGVGLRAPGVIGGSIDLVFDRETLTFLGVRDLLARGDSDVLNVSTARLRTAIVDRIGDLP